MIRFFNPGHEAAVLLDSPFYHPPAVVVKMQEDLAFLPFWYADPGDCIFTPRPLPDQFVEMASRRDIHSFALPISATESGMLKNQEVDFWGISRQAIHLLEQYSEKYALNLKIEEWKEEYRTMSSREFSASCLLSLLKEVPEISRNILPVFYSNIAEIEAQNRVIPSKLLVKSPYSSSGRGLLWLEKPELSRSSRQILQGMLNRQGKVSIENVLDKVVDFSMHFSSEGFIGYSVFQTNSKGAYEKTWLASQEKIESKLSHYVDLNLLFKLKTFLLSWIAEKIRPYYQGAVGVDMMIYRAEGNYYLHPCVEINLRKSMGYLSLNLYQIYLHPDSEGFFSVEYCSEKPIGNTCLIDNLRMREGLTDLCPVFSDTNYRAILEINSKN